LKTNIDNATTKLDSELHVTEKLQILADDLDKASDIINTELNKFSTFLSEEFSQLVGRLSSELDQITVKVGAIDNDRKQVRLTDAVKNAGLSARS
jgi:hypothetical protein